MTDRPWLAHYDPGVPAQLDYPAVPVFHFLDEAARLCPERPCLIFQGKITTYQEAADQTDRLAAALRQLGIHKGERVGICMPNCPEFVLAYFAILKAGGVVVATNPLYTPPEIIHQVNDAGVETAFCAGNLYARFQAARPETKLKRLIVTGEGTLGSSDLPFGGLLDSNSASEVMPGPNSMSSVIAEGESPAFKAGTGSDDIALFQYTGGTTGVAKAAVALHRNLVANTLQFKAWMSTLQEEQETFLLALPVYHIYGMVCGLLLGMALRARLVILPDPRAIPELLRTIRTWHVTYFPAAPTLYNAINNAPDVAEGKIDLTSIKACISGSAPLMEQTKQKFEQLTGGRILEGYGLSEAPTATHCNPLQGENRLGSIGLPLPDVEAKIVDLEDGVTERPVGEPGELIIRSPQVMLGYHGMPEETALAVRDGWLYTGDIARMDADGYFTIVDRKKELIKPGGMEVWPREVEEVLAAHSKVAEAAVAGIPDAYRGETVKAWVVCKPGQSLTKHELQTWCRERLAPFKVPTDIEFLSELPKSTVGKVLKRELVKKGIRY
ncbi:MAG TPA: long-chain fatty acid--CoA ligase [Anaerolineales bacterium]|nr:long-chain fatty acid--CoA ligase [Anaerolineales bacterium]